VVAKDDRVAGVFTLVDVCHTFVEWLRAALTRGKL
jgi:hypothetical protein